MILRNALQYLPFVILFSADLNAGIPDQLAPLQFLLGEWQAVGSGKPGEGTGSSTFSMTVQDHVLLRTSFAAYPPAGDKPAYRHDDLMVVYVDVDSLVKAEYIDNEGHVIRYTVRSPAPGEAVFVSPASPATPRYRLTYKLLPDSTLTGTFEIAPPGKPEAFSTYLNWTSRAAKPEHDRHR